MEGNSRLQAFVQLGKVFNALGEETSWPGFEIGLTESEYAELEYGIKLAKAKNPWFTNNNVRLSFRNWAAVLVEEQLIGWLSSYAVPVPKSQRIGIVMAGNIPLVGLHDLMCVLLSGHAALVKPSSDDEVLIKMVLKLLQKFDPELADQIQLVEQLKNFDAVIATGSNNSARYFEAYFGKYPSIIRKNRTSVAIVNKETTSVALSNLGKDIFCYFGMGCRNVTKIYFQNGFELDRFFEAIYDYNAVINENKYANNFDYHKALYLMNQDAVLENGFVLLKKDDRLASPVGVLFYEYFDSEEVLRHELEKHTEEIQCIVSDKDVPFGQTQLPRLNDYADGVDTISFLAALPVL